MASPSLFPASFASSSSTASPPVISTATVTALPSHTPGRRSSRVKDSFAALAAQEKQLASDPKYKKFSQSVDRTLQSFENVNEWADFITFLAKLLKCLQGYPQFQVIPHKLTVAKRLSQCLNPALPTGVHQRALDVYTHILTAIGPDNLRRDLPAWSSGLFPFFQYAATSVKPIVLGIYERFYLPLQESLRPATKAFILALLPGLEEETGEFFEKVAALLDRMSGTVSPAFFFQNVWLVLITAPNSRIPALNYLAKRLPKMQSEDSVSHIVGQDVGLMVRGFAAALEDPQILVQRGILDLLTTTLKLDSVGFKSTSRNDQVLLMRAVTGVVLRRDLSLSRRLYTWLLGSSEDSDAQVAHLKQYGLKLLRSALKADMDAQTADTADRQRPFKIFISLLDKWEIGGPLTEVLVLDAFAALQASLRPGDDHDELLMTGNMLFEIIDPFLMWKQIYASVKGSVAGSTRTVEAISLARFIVHTFRLHDEEVQKLHAPFVAFGILDLVEATTEPGTAMGTGSPLPAVVDFIDDLLKEITPRFYEGGETTPESLPERLGQSLADGLYSASDMKTASLQEFDGRELLAAGFTSAIRLTERCAKRVALQGADQGTASSLLLASIRIIFTLSEATAHIASPIQIDWQPDSWSDALVSCLSAEPAKVSLFPIHTAIIKVILTLHKTTTVRPGLQKNRRTLIEALISKLLAYLQPACAPCFVEAVQLMWGVENLSQSRHMESMISDRLASPNPATRLPAYEAFGNLWRFTEDQQLPGVVLRTPMFMMLDSLKADDLSTRRAGEAWMRCSLKSYLRILDPLLFTLLDPAIQQVSRTVKVADVDLPILVYQNTFDQARVHHVLDDLLSLARFGGQGFIRIAKGSFLKHSLDPAFRERVRSSELETHTYLDGLISILVRFLRTEPSIELVPSLGPLNHHIHSVVAELLQVVISRGESEVTGLRVIESALTSRLFLCIHRSELDLQNKLLHVLHSVLHVVASGFKRQHKGTGSLDSTTKADSNDAQPPELSHDAMFVRVVSDAISTQRNNAVIHHWIDFLLMTIPQFRQSLNTVVFPLIDCLVLRLRVLVDDFRQTYSDAPSDLPPAEATDAEYTVLMNALERLLLIAVSESSSLTVEEEPKPSERVVGDSSTGTGGAGGLLGYMTGVLGNSEQETVSISEESKTRNEALSRLRDSVNLLLYSWDVTSTLETAVGEDTATSQAHFQGRAKVRARKALERIYKAVPGEVLDNIITFWEKLKPLEAQNKVFAILDILSPSAQTVITMLCEKLAPRATGAVDKHKTPFTATDESSFSFFEAFIDRLEGPNAVQIWGVCLTFVRDFHSNLSTSKPYIFACLRCFTTLSEKVSQTSALEDRRLRRDLQETFIRLVDATIQVAGRAVEQGGWLRKSTLLNGDTDSIMSVDRPPALFEEVEDEKKVIPPHGGQAHEITEYLARRVLADFRRFLIDADKTAAVCSNMVYYLVAPAFKTRSKSFDVDSAVFELLTEMAKNPANVKAWRAQVGDAFADNRFFNAPPTIHYKWKPLIQALMASDKERLVELTAKISTVSSANIFTNRELESLSRALSLRRLTYTIFTGDKNRFLTQLPIIQEKLVDLLRSNVGDMVLSEVYLCLRVLFCRIGNQHLSGLWPVILTELLRLFESLVDHSVPDGSDLLQLVLSACKFLDLTLVLQTEDFQIHEWMFVTDTVDAIYPPDAWLPQAIMDRLGEILGDFHSPPHTTVVLPHTVGARRPLLVARRVNSISDLVRFFSEISLTAYEEVYDSSGKVDWEAVEEALMRDVFDGEV